MYKLLRGKSMYALTRENEKVYDKIIMFKDKLHFRGNIKEDTIKPMEVALVYLNQSSASEELKDVMNLIYSNIKELLNFQFDLREYVERQQIEGGKYPTQRVFNQEACIKDIERKIENFLLRKDLNKVGDVEHTIEIDVNIDYRNDYPEVLDITDEFVNEYNNHVYGFTKKITNDYHRDVAISLGGVIPHSLIINKERHKHDEFFFVNLTQDGYHHEVINSINILRNSFIYLLNSYSMKNGEYATFDRIETESKLEYATLIIKRLKDYLPYELNLIDIQNT